MVLPESSRTSRTTRATVAGTILGTAALLTVQGCMTEVGVENYAEVRDNVVILDQQTGDGIVVEPGRLLVPEERLAQIGTIDVGNIVVSSAGEGYLRRVLDTSVDQNGFVVMNTEEAPLTDAVDSASMHHSFGDGQYFDPDRAEIVDFGINVNYDGTVIYEQDGLQVTLSQGNLTFRPTLDFDFDLSWGRLEMLQLIAEGNLDANLVVTARAQQAFTGSKDFTYTLFESSPKIIVHMLGMLPVVEVITTKVDAHFEITAAVSGEASVGLAADANVLAGMRWEDGAITPITDAGLELEPVGPTLHVGGELVARATIEPRLYVKFYGAAGASVGVQAYGALEAQATVDASVEGVEFQGSCDLLLGISGDVRAELPVFDLDNLDRQLFDLNRTIGCAELGF